MINRRFGCFGIASEIVQPIPVSHVFAGGKRRFADKVSYAFALRVIDDERNETGRVEFELNWNRRMPRSFFSSVNMPAEGESNRQNPEMFHLLIWGRRHSFAAATRAFYHALLNLPS